MCGITGFFNYPDFNNDKSIEKLTSVIKRRGPDDSKTLKIEKKLILIFTRLSIRDKKKHCYNEKIL